jgi:hypothetical protein
MNQPPAIQPTIQPTIQVVPKFLLAPPPKRNRPAPAGVAAGARQKSAVVWAPGGVKTPSAGLWPPKAVSDTGLTITAAGPDRGPAAVYEPEPFFFSADAPQRAKHQFPYGPFTHPRAAPDPARGPVWPRLP